ncbi:MAG: sigma 54-interacting transcriptional regulator [Myxococcales bacterium]|nr:sigma 54-interacting transcriptional regulator [Myxococcales bacterium]MCB9581816.1 sigma 54-interacting transcriptional regulator [Polyangiaceae bacterium]
MELDPAAPQQFLVGQSATCALSLTDSLVSRRHVALSVEGPELHLFDQRSTNGTFVNGVRVAEAYLRGGETIGVGATQIRVSQIGDEPTPGLNGSDRYGPLIGGSPCMRRLHPLLERLAVANVPVIVEGETGTGKEVVAEALHEGGPRSKRPFAVFDCTAVAPSLVEAALFGHEKGAFTGATTSRLGVFEQAHGGTLLIDEIGDLDLSLQPKLLRAVERSEIRRVGGQDWIRVDVRILAATRRDLDLEVQVGRFREDLFYRLNIARVELPPLRERPGDVALLARYFWDRLGGRALPIPYDLFESWEDYHWPGNVRELENAVARRLALGELAPTLQEGNRTRAGERLEVPFQVDKALALARGEAVAEFERAYLERLLSAHSGNVTDAARAAGVGRRYFNMLRARHGV